jgi:mannose-6-phosphate isomerase-like protein (cupin superfamily)
VSEGKATELTIRHLGDEPWESAERFGFPPGPECRVFQEASETGGVLNVVGRMPAGFVEPEHVHEDIDHWCVVLEGEMHVGGEILRPGDYLFAPRGVPHGPLGYPVGCTIFTSVRGAEFAHDFGVDAKFSA